jgi:hypothetical protein
LKNELKLRYSENSDASTSSLNAIIENETQLSIKKRRTLFEFDKEQQIGRINTNVSPKYEIE